MTPFSQSVGNFSRYTKEFERMLLSGQIILDNNPITRWCFSNVDLYTDINENVKPRKQSADGKIDGVLPAEIFSNLGSGTMIYTTNYGKIRSMTQKDIPSVLAIMRPFIQSGKLLPRTEEQLKETFENYIVYEIDSTIHACSALNFYSDGQAEIAAVAVDEAYRHMGIGPKMIEKLIETAKIKNSNSIFIMTTQAADWFEKMGFAEASIDSLPPERRAKWSPERNSKVYRLK